MRILRALSVIAFEKLAKRAGVIGAGLCLVLMSFDGCSPPKSQINYDPGEYQKILDHQKAGLALPPEEKGSVHKEMSGQEMQRLGDLYLQQGNPAMAILQYQKAVEADSSLFRVHLTIGELFLKKGLPQDAMQHFQEVLKHDEHDALALEGLGQAHFRMGKEEEAEAAFRKAIALQPDRWQTHNFLGTLLDRQKRHKDAIVEYEEGLRVRPNEATLLNNIGLAYYLEGRYEDAVQAFQHALMTGSGQAKIHNNLGLALAKLNRHHDALESFRQGSSEEEAYNNLGVYYLSSGAAGNAVACFKKAIELSPRYYDKANENLLLAKRAAEKQQKASHDSTSVESFTCPS